MVLTTANDAVERDPTFYRLWGTNDNLDIAALDHTNGLMGNWTLISEGPVSLLDDRLSPGDVIPLNGANTGDFDGDSDADGSDFLTWQRNLGRSGTGTRALGDANGDTNVNATDLAFWRRQFGETLGGAGKSFTTYRLIFPTVKNSAVANSMQIANIDVFTSSDGTGTSILAFDDPVAAIDMPALVPGAPQSRSPGNETAPLAIDGDPGTKYLNFGENNSGFIVTPAVGATKVTSFVITTANDAEPRDPATWQLFGTNDPIMSTNHSRGMGETWTLIDEGTLELPPDRNTEGPVVPVENTTAYLSYRLVFPAVKNAATANSMQISEIQFDGTIGAGAAALAAVPEPNSALLAIIGALFAARAFPGRRG
jgi:hypothetical protein